MVKKWHADGGDEQFRFDYDLDQNSLVIDLGGYKGQWASDIFSRYRCNIIVFEPVKDFAQKIEKRFAKNEKIVIETYGLGGLTRKELMGINGEGSSMFTNSEIKEQVTIIDVVEWIDKNSINFIDLMKINIEGGEYELLERLIDSGLISIIQNIQIQFHIISQDSDHRMETIQEHLRKTHVPTYQYRFVWENWKKII
ncbi:MAG: FkbM family methyltransferase, partial [Deltaproteobacteria bacterium]